MKVAGVLTLTAASLSSLAAASPSFSLERYNHILPRQTTQQSTFDPLSSQLLAVYYGKAQNNANPSLYDLCSDSDVDVIVMGFVRQLNGASKQPTFDFTSSCKTATKTPANGNSTVTCPGLASNISYCQSVGKKVMLSLGGSSSNLTLNTASDAQQAANILWNVFGAGTATPWLRPLGNVTLDGFDFDLEAGAITTYTDVLASSLQSLFSTSTPARYISAAPLCANNTVMPYPFYASANFIWPRFYNAKSCCVGSKGYNASIASWSSFLSSVKSNISPHYPRFYIGALGFDNANSGFVTPETLSDVVEYTKEKVGKEKFGGVSVWEGTDALLTKSGDGRDLLNVTKEALLVPFTSDACGRLDNRVLAVLKLIRGQIDRWIGRGGKKVVACR